MILLTGSSSTVGNTRCPKIDEIDSLVASGKNRLIDAQNMSLNIDSRFDRAYNESHSLAWAALRKNGYRSSKKFLVFQCLEHTLGIPPEQWRVIDTAHKIRNNAEYERLSSTSKAIDK